MAAGAGRDAARLEAELLLGHVLGRDRAWLFAWPERDIGDVDSNRFRALLGKRLDGHPIAYLTGHREFWSLDLEVNASVLIPRPETELLVETALERMPAAPGPRCADLGTGSGAVALAIARERPDAMVIATELSPEAVLVARRNAQRLGLTNVEVRQGSWTEPLDGVFDVLVSNPPYLAATDPHLDEGDLRFEPRGALTAADSGLADLREIARQARSHLRPGGHLVLEHGHEQGEAVRGLLADLGYTGTQTRRDLAGLDRISSGARPA